MSGTSVDETRMGKITFLSSSTPYTLIDMLFVVAKEPTEERGTGKCRKESSYLPIWSLYWLIRSPKILKTLYYSLIYPHLIYAIEVWGSADNTHLNHIFMLQKKTVRMINYSDKRQPDFAFPSADPLFLKLGFLKVHNIFRLKLAKFIHQFK